MRGSTSTTTIAPAHRATRPSSRGRANARVWARPGRRDHRPSALAVERGIGSRDRTIGCADRDRWGWTASSRGRRLGRDPGASGASGRVRRACDAHPDRDLYGGRDPPGRGPTHRPGTGRAGARHADLARPRHLPAARRPARPRGRRLPRARRDPPRDRCVRRWRSGPCDVARPLAVDRAIRGRGSAGDDAGLRPGALPHASHRDVDPAARRARRRRGRAERGAGAPRGGAHPPLRGGTGRERPAP